MPRTIVTGNYTASAMKGKVENPSDREAAARAIVEAAGDTLESYSPDHWRQRFLDQSHN